jgi:O-glycosyl hydrolase
VSIPATTSDTPSVTCYASLHANATDHVVLVAINKATSDKTAALRLTHPTTFTRLSSYRIAGTSTDIAKQSDQTSSATNAWKVTLPAQSVSVLVPQP